MKEKKISLTKKSSDIYVKSIINLLSLQNTQMLNNVYDYYIDDIKINLEHKELNEILTKSNFYKDISLNEDIINNYIKTIKESGASIKNYTDIISYINLYNKNYEYKELDDLIIKTKYKFRNNINVNVNQYKCYIYENNKFNKLNNTDVKKTDLLIPIEHYLYLNNQDLFFKYVNNNLINLENNNIIINNIYQIEYYDKNENNNFTANYYLSNKENSKINEKYIIFNDCDLLNSIFIDILFTEVDNNSFKYLKNIKKIDIKKLLSDKLILNKNVENFLINPNSLLSIEIYNYELEESNNYLEKLDFCEKILGKKYLTIELSKIIFNIHQITNLEVLDEEKYNERKKIHTKTITNIKNDIINLSQFDSKNKKECIDIIFQTLNNCIGEMINNQYYINNYDNNHIDLNKEILKHHKELFISIFDIINVFDLSNEEKMNYNKILLKNIKLELSASLAKDVNLIYNYKLDMIVNPKDISDDYDEEELNVYYKITSLIEKECLLLDNIVSSKLNNNVVKDITDIKVKKPKFKI